MSTKKIGDVTVKTVEVATRPTMVTTAPFDRVPNYYANQASVRTNQLDVQVIHGQIVDVESDKITVMPQAIVHMSHVHARRLANILIEQLAYYEKQFGKLPEDPELPARTGTS